MTADHLMHHKFERLVQLQIFEHEDNNRFPPRFPNEAMRTRLNKNTGRVKVRRDNHGFGYTAATPHLRLGLSVRFAFPIRQKPLRLTLRLRRPTRRGAHHSLHKDRNGFDIVFGGALLVRPEFVSPEFQTGIRLPVDAVLTARFAQRLRALPNRVHLTLEPRLP